MDTAAIQSDWVGRLIGGRFTLLEWLGGSGQGNVFLTEFDGQKAAIKVIPEGIANAEFHIAAWKSAKALSHPHLMRILETGRCSIDGVSYLCLVTEYAEEVLSQILPERPLTPDETAEMLDPILDAVSWLHDKGIVHGHIKPTNILVVGDQLKLSSDGLCFPGQPGLNCRAPDIYIAPEAATGIMSPAADVWSLGVTLVEALTQHPPAWDSVTLGDPVVPPSIPSSLAEIARECLHANPTQRCTLGDIKARLHPELPAPEPSREPTIEPWTAPRREPDRPTSSRMRVPALIAAVFVLLVVIAVVELRSRHIQPGFETGKSLVLNAPKPSPASRAPKARASRTQLSQIQPSQPGGAIVDQVMPDILPSATESIHGQVNVDVKVEVDAAGNVANASLGSPGPSKYFARQALDAARRWKFKPSQGNNQRISSTWLLQFTFTRAGTDVAPIQTSP